MGTEHEQAVARGKHRAVEPVLPAAHLSPAPVPGGMVELAGFLRRHDVLEIPLFGRETRTMSQVGRGWIIRGTHPGIRGVGALPVTGYALQRDGERFWLGAGLVSCRSGSRTSRLLRRPATHRYWAVGAVPTVADAEAFAATLDEVAALATAAVRASQPTDGVIVVNA